MKTKEMNMPLLRKKITVQGPVSHLLSCSMSSISRNNELIRSMYLKYNSGSYEPHQDGCVCFIPARLQPDPPVSRNCQVLTGRKTTLLHGERTYGPVHHPLEYPFSRG